MGGIVVAQAVTTLLASALCLLVDRFAVFSALLAGMVCVVPSAYVWLLSQRPMTTGSTGMGLVIRSELGKYALWISLMAVVFIFYEPLNVMAFFGTLVLLQISVVIGPVIEAQRLLNRHRSR
ncbi:MAG: ATP synthase protein I [Candidatus Azotimanducaceae bacterium]|jgi:ATP synthase protein I